MREIIGTLLGVLLGGVLTYSVGVLLDNKDREKRYRIAKIALSAEFNHIENIFNGLHNAKAKGNILIIKNKVFQELIFDRVIADLLEGKEEDVKKLIIFYYDIKQFESFRNDLAANSELKDIAFLYDQSIDRIYSQLKPIKSILEH